MPRNKSWEGQLSLLTQAQLKNLQDAFPIRDGEVETASPARRGVRREPRSEDGVIQERLPGFTWPE